MLCVFGSTHCFILTAVSHDRLMLIKDPNKLTEECKKYLEVPVFSAEHMCTGNADLISELLKRRHF